MRERGVVLLVLPAFSPVSFFYLTLKTDIGVSTLPFSTSLRQATRGESRCRCVKSEGVHALVLPVFTSALISLPYFG